MLLSRIFLADKEKNVKRIMQKLCRRLNIPKQQVLLCRTKKKLVWPIQGTFIIL